MINTTNSDPTNVAVHAQHALIAGAAEGSNPPNWSLERLLRLPYERRHKNGATEYGITMPGGYWIDEALVKTAWRHFWAHIHVLDFSRLHTAEDLCGADSWDRYHRRDCLKLGRCFKYFATNRVLPITLANPDKKGKRKYRLDEDLVSAPTLH